MNRLGLGMRLVSSGSAAIDPPSAPTGLGATAGNTVVDLAWDSASSVTWKAYRGTTDVFGDMVLLASGLASAAYQATGLTNGTTYYFRIVATNSGGDSSPSAAANAAPGVAPANTVAPTITGDAEVGESAGGADGTWTGSPAPTFTYQWELSSDGVSSWANISGETAGTYLIDDLDDSKYIRRKVTGTNVFGAASVYTAALGPITTPLAALPGIVALLEVSSVAGVGDGNLIDTYPDTMGGADGTAVTTARPTYDADGLNGHPGVRFVPPNTITFARGPYTVPWAEFYVVDPDAHASRQLFKVGPTSNVPYLEQNIAGYLNSGTTSPAGLATLTGFPIPNEKPFVIGQVVTASARTLYWNRTVVGTSAGNFSNQIIKFPHPGPTFGMTGWQGEVIMFDEEPSDATLAKMFGKLESMYEIPHNCILLEGDSIVNGHLATTGWPARLHSEFATTYGNQRYTAFQFGVNSQQIAGVVANMAAKSFRFATVAGSRKNIIGAAIGTNDLWAGRTAQQVKDDLEAMVVTMLTTGALVFLQTIINHATSGANAGSWTQVAADSVNDHIRSNAVGWGCSAVVDCQALAGLQDVSGPNFADDVHPNDDGHILMQGSWSDAITPFL